MLYLLFLIWPVVSICLFFFIKKRWGKKNHIVLSIFYAITLLIPFPLEKLVEISIRNKYARLTPKVLQLLNEAKVPYHVVFGTFLFFYRNGSFKDNDIDLAVWKKDWNKDVEARIAAAGFIKKESFFLDGKIRENCYRHKSLSISMDIFVIDEKSPNGIGFDEDNNRYCTKPVSYRYKLKQRDYKGIKFAAPEDGEKYLTWIYGAWQKPDPNYHWFYGSTTNPNKIVEKAKIIHKEFK